MNYVIAGAVVVGLATEIPILAMVFTIRKVLCMFEQDLHEALEIVALPSIYHQPRHRS
jgi:hypothetical protein